MCFVSVEVRNMIEENLIVKSTKNVKRLSEHLSKEKYEVFAD